MSKALKILIADDHEMIRKGLTLMLETQKEIKLTVSQASNGIEVLQQTNLNTFDLIILDINMPLMDGITTLSKLKECNISTPILMLSMHKEEKLIKQAIKSGATGYILKNSSLDEIIKAITKTIKRERYYSNEVSQLLINENSQNKKELLNNEFNLTLREIQILSMLVKEMTSQEIGDYLFISKRTVEGHRNKIMDKVGVKSSIGLVKFALQHGLE
jgi:two-component system, NarL family, response regulator NreC